MLLRTPYGRAYIALSRSSQWGALLNAVAIFIAWPLSCSLEGGARPPPSSLSSTGLGA